MTVLEVLLIIFGFVLVSLSFLISNKTEKETKVEVKAEPHAAEVLWTDKDEEMIRNRVDRVLGEKVNVMLDTAGNRMARISNDKIMAVDEFSNQILEKIEQNHKEVVFMYNMLEEKEKELKKLTATKSVQPPKKVVNRETAIHTLLKETKTKDKETKTTPTQPQPKAKAPVQETIPFNSDAMEINDQIRKLYKTGKSVLEISKELNMGQGEVKLVIDLYGGK